MLCRKHYSQMREYGRILERTKFDKNEIIICDEYAEICLYDKDHAIIAKSLIDLEDVDKAKEHHWRKSIDGYVTTDIISNGKKSVMFLQNLVMPQEEGKYVDHIFHKTLDNRKSQLRLCTWSENNCNKDKQSNNTSGHKGITYAKDRNRWVAQIGKDNKHYHIGSYKTLEEALEAYKVAAAKYHGEFVYRGESNEGI